MNTEELDISNCPAISDVQIAKSNNNEYIYGTCKYSETNLKGIRGENIRGADAGISFACINEEELLDDDYSDLPLSLQAKQKYIFCSELFLTGLNAEKDPDEIFEEIKDEFTSKKENNKKCFSCKEIDDCYVTGYYTVNDADELSILSTETVCHSCIVETISGWQEAVVKGGETALLEML